MKAGQIQAFLPFELESFRLERRREKGLPLPTDFKKQQAAVRIQEGV